MALILALLVLLYPVLMAGVIISPLETRMKIRIGVISAVVLAALPVVFVLFSGVFH